VVVVVEDPILKLKNPVSHSDCFSCFFFSLLCFFLDEVQCTSAVSEVGSEKLASFPIITKVKFSIESVFLNIPFLQQFAICSHIDSY